MSLLQDPLKALDQIDWFLDNQSQEKFPGAYLKAAGNLSRQVLEQILFILAFYSEIPQNKYMKTDLRLKMADHVWKALQEKNPTTNRTYLEEARLRSDRIRKFAKSPRSMNMWREEFNETSHFRNPAQTAHTNEQNIRNFVLRMRGIIDPLDTHLITAAVNEIISRGKIKAIIGKELPNAPGIVWKSVVKPEYMLIIDGQWSFKGMMSKFQVVPADKEISLIRWRNTPMIVQGSVGILISTQFVTEDGQPINITNFGLCRNPI